MNYIIALIAC